MRATKQTGAIGATAALALILCALALGVSEASAAVPEACVRNRSGAEIDVILSSPEGRPDRGVHRWGTLAPHGGQCAWTDMDLSSVFFFRRAGSAPPLAADEAPTAAAGWKTCPAYRYDRGVFIYTIRRGLFGLTCKRGGDIKGLEGPGDYD